MNNFTPTEMMTIAAARALSNDDVCFVGIGRLDRSYLTTLRAFGGLQCRTADACTGHHADL